MRLFVDSLTVIDFSYLHPERGLLGESWLLDIELEGSLDQQGMVLDFGEIKRQVKQTVDADYDHKLLMPIRHTGIQINEKNQYCNVSFRDHSRKIIFHSGPASATCLLDVAEITPDTLARAIEQRLQPILPDNVSTVTVHLRTEKRGGAYYHVSHGLKYHIGNCQRIAHGHRSYIEIYKDDERSSKLEADWAERWRDIYIGTRADLEKEYQRDGVTFYCFGYRSEQGQFKLELPRENCYLIDTDSTVENLAQHIIEILSKEYPESSIKVRLYEGVGKGAIAES